MGIILLLSNGVAFIAKNKTTREYRSARKQMLKELPPLTKKNARKGKAHACSGGWIKLTRVYRLTEQEANEKALLFLDRWEGVDHNGMFQGGAFHDGDKLSTTKNWKL